MNPMGQIYKPGGEGGGGTEGQGPDVVVIFLLLGPHHLRSCRPIPGEDHGLAKSRLWGRLAGREAANEDDGIMGVWNTARALPLGDRELCPYEKHRMMSWTGWIELCTPRKKSA